MRLGVHIGRELRKGFETKIVVIIGVLLEKVDSASLVGQTFAADLDVARQNG